MSYAPATLLTLQAYLRDKTGLAAISIGIVGNTAHKSGYHLGRDRIYSASGQGALDYSVRTSRDKNGLTNAASAMDIGNFGKLRHLSIWLVRECQRNAPGTSDIREIIYSPDGDMVLRYDRQRGITSAPKLGEADNSHRTHTHISWYRDSQSRDKLKVFRPFFETVKPEIEVGQSFTFENNIRVGTLFVLDDVPHAYQRLSDFSIHRIDDVDAFGIKNAFGPVRLTVPIPGGQPGEDRRTVYIMGDEAAAILVKDVIFRPLTDDVAALKNLLYPKLAELVRLVG